MFFHRVSINKLAQKTKHPDSRGVLEDYIAAASSAGIASSVAGISSAGISGISAPSTFVVSSSMV